MRRFINPEELTSIMAVENGPLLLVSLDKNNSFFNQQQTLEVLYNLFGERLQIFLLDIEYQNAITEKFKVHGFPAFIFCERGRKKDALLGTPDPKLLREFVIKNFFSNGASGYESLQSIKPLGTSADG